VTMSDMCVCGTVGKTLPMLATTTTTTRSPSTTTALATLFTWPTSPLDALIANASSDTSNYGDIGCDHNVAASFDDVFVDRVFNCTGNQKLD
jgi:hypothetical protein